MKWLEKVASRLDDRVQRWIVTGAAGFIGSHLVEFLLGSGQQVIGIDNFATGRRSNLDDVRRRVGESAWQRFELREGDVADEALMAEVTKGSDYVLHQAALGSVPRSIENPIATNRANVDGFLTVATAAARNGVKRLVYASSSSVYGDHPGLPKHEETIGAPLSPYAVSKRTDELYAAVFGNLYETELVGLRYFNVFGPRQDPQGPYAAVIPRWARALLAGEPTVVYGDGQTTRDFCYVDNAVQANILAALTDNSEAVNTVYNIAVGEQTSLLGLHRILAELSAELTGRDANLQPEFRDFRPGDVAHSLASISKAHLLLGYEPTHRVREGLRETVRWYAAELGLLA